MKRLILLLSTVAFLAAWTTHENVFAGEKEKILKLASRNLKSTLDLSSDMLRESAIFAVLDIKSTYPDLKMNEVIIPLMKILRTHDDPNMRLLAAMALYEVGDDRALLAIREAVKFDPHHLVRHVCACMYNEANL